MFSNSSNSRKSISRATFLLLLLASLLAFRYGWLVRSARAIGEWSGAEDSEKNRSNVIWTDWQSRFATEYKRAKATALAKPVSSPPWYAGSYEVYFMEHMGDTHSNTILITPSNEYFDEIKSCITSGPVKFGTVRTLDDGLLELCPKARNQPGSEHCSMSNVIRLGDRQYLIPLSSLDGFARALADGAEPRKDGVGSFFMRKGDWDKPVQGRPQLRKVD
jgi:hypothetical protein